MLSASAEEGLDRDEASDQEASEDLVMQLRYSQEQLREAETLLSDRDSTIAQLDEHVAHLEEQLESLSSNHGADNANVHPGGKDEDALAPLDVEGDASQWHELSNNAAALRHLVECYLQELEPDHDVLIGIDSSSSSSGDLSSLAKQVIVDVRTARQGITQAYAQRIGDTCHTQ